MNNVRILSCLSVAFVLVNRNVSCQSDDGYTDENRPYKFGFNIEGYQHRKEEKDDRGIIKGEFGFITADGYYRVTVYATDENGDFRILSMKNYYVGFPPEDPTTTPLPPSREHGSPQRTNSPQSSFAPHGNEPGAPGSRPVSAGNVRRPGSVGNGQRTPESQNLDNPQKKPAQVNGLSGCSDCLIPTTRKPDFGGHAGVNNYGENISNDQRGRITSGGGFGPGGNTGRVRGGNSEQHQRPGTNGNKGSGRIPESNFIGDSEPGRGGNVQNPGRGGHEERLGPGRGEAGRVGGSAPFGGGDTRRGDPPQRFSPGNAAKFPGPGRSHGTTPGGGAPGRVGTGGFAPHSGDRPSNPESGRVRDGLPNGITADDVKALLYRFNYTVGFHGHHEDGYRNGDKEGDYFFDGRDGVERKVEYIANEFGYQPNITFVDLGENDPRRPNERTEKEYGLKGYEFKWFYRK